MSGARCRAAPCEAAPGLPGGRGRVCVNGRDGRPSRPFGVFDQVVAFRWFFGAGGKTVVRGAWPCRPFRLEQCGASSAL
ncbi:hypothetical protein GCM10023085_78300 [Actinomadura viridis]